MDIDQGIHKGKMKVARNEKRKKLHGFSFSINIANFEAFLSRIKLIKNLLFLKSVILSNNCPKSPQKYLPKICHMIFYFLAADDQGLCNQKSTSTRCIVVGPVTPLQVLPEIGPDDDQNTIQE